VQVLVQVRNGSVLQSDPTTGACASCGACCREAFDSVPVAPDDHAIRAAHPELVRIHDDGWVDLHRAPSCRGGTRCAALQGDGSHRAPYRCEVYRHRPTNCRELEEGSENCSFARRRVGLPPVGMEPSSLRAAARGPTESAALRHPMQMSDRTDIGLRAMILIGAAAPERLSSHDIAIRHRVSFTHLQKVIRRLQHAGFVRTFRGRSGGVELARDPAEIRVGDVVRALEPHLHIVPCLQHGNLECRLTGGCALTLVVANAWDAMLRELDATTLDALITGSPAIATLITAPVDGST